MEIIALIVGILAGIVAILDWIFKFLPRKRKGIKKVKIPFTVESKIGRKGSHPNEFINIRGIVTDDNKNVYVCDGWNHRIQVFDEHLTYIRSYGKKGKKVGEFDTPTALSFDSEGFLYIVDRWNNRIQKFDKNFKYISSIGDGFLITPWGLCIDNKNNIYVSCAKAHEIKKFNFDGELVKSWGTKGIGNGEFNNPLGMAIDDYQNIYVVDNINNRVQKFNQDGRFILEFGIYGSDPGNLLGPHAIAVYNNIVYVTELLNNIRIQIFDLVGNYVGEVTPINDMDVKFHTCKGIAVNKNGDLYVADHEMVQLIKLKKV